MFVLELNIDKKIYIYCNTWNYLIMCNQMINIKLFVSENNSWNDLTVFKAIINI